METGLKTGSRSPSVCLSVCLSVSVNRSQLVASKGLKISSVQPSDDGVYVCHAENDIGSRQAHANLTVLSTTVALFNGLIITNIITIIISHHHCHRRSNKFTVAEKRRDVTVLNHTFMYICITFIMRLPHREGAL